MKIKDGYMVREVAGSQIVVPVGERTVDFNGIITLNETAAFLCWRSTMLTKQPPQGILTCFYKN